MQILPRIEVSAAIRGLWEGAEEEQEKTILLDDRNSYISVTKDQEYTIEVRLKRVNNFRVSIAALNFLL